MKYLRDTIAGGILFLVPIVVLAIIVGRALAMANRIVAPLAAHLSIHPVICMHIQRVLAIAVIILFCFLTGFLARTNPAQKLIRWLESKLLVNVPGYELIKRIEEDVLGIGNPEWHPAVFAHIGDTWQIGFEIEQLDNGLVAVFFPNAPNPYSGVVRLVPSSQVTLVKLPHGAIFKSLKRLGAGSNALFGNLPAASKKGNET